MNNEFKLTPFSIHFLNMMSIVFTSALCGSIISNTEHIPLSIGLFVFLLVVAFAFAGFIYMKFKTVNDYVHDMEATTLKERLNNQINNISLGKS